MEDLIDPFQGSAGGQRKGIISKYDVKAGNALLKTFHGTDIAFLSETIQQTPSPGVFVKQPHPLARWIIPKGIGQAPDSGYPLGIQTWRQLGARVAQALLGFEGLLTRQYNGQWTAILRGKIWLG